MTTYYKGKIGREDIAYGVGTFLRRNSLGAYEEFTRILDPSKNDPANFGPIDGINDEVQIQAALDKYGICILQCGTEYIIDASIIMDDEYTLIGCGVSSVLKAGVGLTADLITNADLTNGNTDVTLRNFKIDGNNENCDLVYFDGSENTRFTIDNILADDAPGYYGIYMGGGLKSNLLFCKSESTLGITMPSSTYSNIAGCYDDVNGNVWSIVFETPLLWF
jgi:hypothetical protein